MIIRLAGALAVSWLGCSTATPAGDADAERALAVPTSGFACTSYCQTFMKACEVEYPQFPSMDACLRACAFYPAPMPNDNGTNTLGCRGIHAIASLSDTQHCFHAGPYGYGGCGALCDGFCQLAMGWCGARAPFASIGACSTECNAWMQAPTGADGITVFRFNTPTSGNTRECREALLMRSLQSAADRDADCPNIGTTSAQCM
jgi:hypothetical protein